MLHTSNDVSNNNPDEHRTAAVVLFEVRIESFDAAVKTLYGRAQVRKTNTNCWYVKLFKSMNWMHCHVNILETIDDANMAELS